MDPISKAIAHIKETMGSITVKTDAERAARAKAYREKKMQKEDVNLSEAETKYVIKHKKTKQVLSTHDNYETAKDEYNGLGADKVKHGIYKQTKKDAALRNRNTYRESVSPLQKIRMDKEKADRNKDDKAKTQAQRITNKQYAGYKVKLKTEEVELDEVQISWHHKTQKYHTIKHPDGSHWGVFDHSAYGTKGHEIRKIRDSEGNALRAKDSRKQSGSGYKAGMGSPSDAAKEWAKKHGGTITNHKIKEDISEAKDGDGANIVRDREFKGKKIKHTPAKPGDKGFNTYDKLKGTRPAWMDREAKMKKEEVELDEVLDRPGALDSYRKKADASGNKARNSATRKILTAPKNGERPDHSAELKTMKKRNKGQDMADRVADRQFRKLIGQPYIKKESVELDEVSNTTLQRYKSKAGKIIDNSENEGEVKKRGKGYALASKKLTDRITREEVKTELPADKKPLRKKLAQFRHQE